MVIEVANQCSNQVGGSYQTKRQFSLILGSTLFVANNLLCAIFGFIILF